MLKRTGLCLLFGVVGAAPACGSPSDNNFSGPAAAGSAVKGGASGSAGASTAGKGGTSSTGGSATGGTGGSTGGTGGSDVGGTGMGGSATLGGSSGTTTTGGTDPGVGGTDPGIGGDPGMGGDPGLGGTGMTTGGAGGMAGKPGNGGSGGKANCDELAMQYADALEAARACNARSGKEQCTETTPSSLTCGCDVPVNPDNTDAVAELERLRKAGAGCAMACPAIACIKPGPAECGQDGADRGLCRSIGAILQ